MSVTHSTDTECAGLAAAAVSEVDVGGEPLHVRIDGRQARRSAQAIRASRPRSAKPPNLAGRLQGLAGPDQVVIDAATRGQIDGLFECQDLGAVELKVCRRRWRHGEAMLQSRFEALHGGP
jgi:class 3 adenylate cyclase